jgi:hypothetical protein
MATLAVDQNQHLVGPSARNVGGLMMSVPSLMNVVEKLNDGATSCRILRSPSRRWIGWRRRRCNRPARASQWQCGL